MEEQKLEIAAPSEGKDEREKWLLRLETQMRATEKNEKSVVKYGENFLRRDPKAIHVYNQLSADPQQQQLQTTRDQSYQTLKHTFAEGKTKFLKASESVASLTGKYQAKITALEEETKKLSAEKIGYQHQIEGIKKEQRELIEESLKLFGRYETQLDELLKQLAKQPINPASLRACQDLTEDAGGWRKKLTDENSRPAPDFERCKEYIVAAGKAYQACYASILNLTSQQGIGKEAGPGNTQVAGGNINAKGAQISVEQGDVHIGNKIIVHIHQAATQSLADMAPQIQAVQKSLEDADTKYNALQQDYQEKEKELALKKAELEIQRSALFLRDQAFSVQLAQVQAEKIAAEKSAAEQIEKINETLTKTTAEIAGRNEEIEKLKAKLEAAEATAIKIQAEAATKAGLFAAAKAAAEEKELAPSANPKDIAEITELLKWGKHEEIDVKLKLPQSKQLALSKELFLLFVAAGEQDRAEAMLKTNSRLAEAKGTVIDLSGRTFEDITGFQYAVWALDWHMWKMIFNLKNPNQGYLTPAQAVSQIQGLAQEKWVKTYGMHFNFVRLLNALDAYIQDYYNWSEAQRATHWCQQVGDAQWWLPAHVINEYCRPDRSFDPTPDFKEKALPRTMKMDREFWFSAEGNGEKLSVKSAVTRASSACAGRWVASGAGWGSTVLDHQSLIALEKTRLRQLDELKATLTQHQTPAAVPGS